MNDYFLSEPFHLFIENVDCLNILLSVRKRCFRFLKLVLFVPPCTIQLYVLCSEFVSLRLDMPQLCLDPLNILDVLGMWQFSLHFLSQFLNSIFAVFDYFDSVLVLTVPFEQVLAELPRVHVFRLDFVEFVLCVHFD